MDFIYFFFLIGYGIAYMINNGLSDNIRNFFVNLITITDIWFNYFSLDSLNFNIVSLRLNNDVMWHYLKESANEMRQVFKYAQAKTGQVKAKL